ncbi:MAG: ribosome biogenesis GTP-binding protein YihA/YsxC [Eubacteriales bacterium]|nr:ribosome biogenesis GTP-binding protein YihA/YsxC [Eubacteriales bacterium]
MLIKKSELEIVIGPSSKVPITHKKEFVIVGKSNVGKSSFINVFLNRKKLARVSNTPGKTRTINYYLVNEKFYLVDIPGYGYAKVSKNEKDNWNKLINNYFQNSKDIEEIIMLVDIRHSPTKLDEQMYQFIVNNTGYEPIIVATKLDKIKKSELDEKLKCIRDTLFLTESCIIIPFSATKKENLTKIYEIFDKIIDE